MDYHEREYHVNRILSPVAIFRAGGTLFRLQQNFSLESRHLSSLVYNKIYRKCIKKGIDNEKKLLQILVDRGLWTADDEQKWNKVESDILDFKVKIFQCDLKEKERETYRQYLGQARTIYSSLNKKRNLLGGYSAESVASLAKLHCLIQHNLVRKNKKQPDGNTIAIIAKRYNSSFLSETEYRELARSTPFRDLWSLSKGKVVRQSASLYSDEQRLLFSWARIYDNVYNSHNCPADSVISDDDALDGWFILQKREREKNEIDRRAEEFVGRHPNSQELFIPANSMKDAEKIDKMNDTGAKIIKRQRLNVVKEHGVVDHGSMPDIQQQLQIQVNQSAMTAAKGN